MDAVGAIFGVAGRMLILARNGGRFAAGPYVYIVAQEVDSSTGFGMDDVGFSTDPSKCGSAGKTASLNAYTSTFPLYCHR